MHSAASVLGLCWWSWVLLSGVARGDPATTACSLLTTALPNRVAHIFSVQYSDDNEHWAGSSSQVSKCTVEPASPADVATIFHVINQTRTPWAVKGGGHAYNPGFSSTPGVQISLSQFDEITYDASTSTAKIGAGNIWDDVYATLVPSGVNVVGGRVPGVGACFGLLGVAGFTLGGGYGWTTQQYGLTIDTATAFDLVTPTGNIMTVTEQSNSDLFFGLRGGGNNFGIVTGFTLKTHAQTQVYGGALIYAGDLSAVTDAIINFDANNADPKAAMLASYTFIALTVEAVVFLFYDGPTPPSGTFSEFLSIPALVNTVKTQSYPNFIQSLGLSPNPTRAAAHTAPIIQYTRPIVEQIINQTHVLGSQIVTPGLGVFATLSIESFTRNLYDHSAGGAYPHSSAHPWTPFQVLVDHLISLNDAAFLASVKRSTLAVQQVAIQEGQSSSDAILYNNYAQKGTDLSLLYGSNLPMLQALRAQYDPQNLLSLTGGWHF